MIMDDSELIRKLREAIESDEDEIVRIIECKFLFDEYDRSNAREMIA